MIQIVLLNGRDYINEHKSFEDTELTNIMEYIRQAVKNDDHTVIEISKWEPNTIHGGHYIPSKLMKKRGRP